MGDGRVNRFKRVASLTVAAVCFVLPLFSASASAIYVSAQVAVLYCVESGEVLFAQNEHQRRSMASTTKIMTALLLLEQGTPQKQVVVTEQMIAVEGTSMGLSAGDTVTFRDLVIGMLLESGNDAANTAAVAVAGSAAAFADLMNERARSLGMAESHFVTPSGLDDEAHYTTAYDMALLGAAAIQNPAFRAVCSQKQMSVCFGVPPCTRTFSNHNRLLWQYPDAIGIKTGFTKKSGRCLVSAAKRGSVTLVAVTLNDGDDWNDHIAMLDYGFDKVKTQSPQMQPLSLPIVGGVKGSVPLTVQEPEALVAEGAVEVRVLLPHFVYAPVAQDSVVGSVQYRQNGNVLAEVPILADETVGAKASPKVQQSKSKGKMIKEKAKEWLLRFFRK